MSFLVSEIENKKDSCTMHRILFIIKNLKAK